MPYVKKAEREKLDEIVDALVTQIKTCSFEDRTTHDAKAIGPNAHCHPLLDYAGRLNYVITRLAIALLLPYKKYWAYALIRGVFQDASDEMYRRLVAPYEDEKIAENGDVY